jgi:hypothetical protein
MPLVMICFLGWGALCTLAVLRGRMLLWTALCLLPLGAISLGWWWDHAGGQPVEDPFGFEWLNLMSFVAMSFITASTGTLSLVVGGSAHAAARSNGAGPAKGGCTLWQRLWWKPLPGDR